MSRWLSTADLVGLPGLPATRFGVIKKAAREGWTCRPRKASGGGREYRFADLPERVRIEIARRAAAEYSQSLPAELISIDTVADTDGRAAARAAALGAFGRFAADSLMSLTTAAAPFAALYLRGETSVPAWARQIIGHRLSASTLMRWQRAALAKGLAGLTHKWGQHRKGSGFFGQRPDLREFCVGLLAGRPHFDAAQLLEAVKTRLDDGTKPPSLRCVERWLKGWREENAGLFLAATNPDRHRSLKMLAFGSASEAVSRVNQLWETDSTLGDIEVVTEDGRRHAIVGVIDVATRRGRLLLSPTSSGLAITACWRRAILAFGLPEAIKSDNGKDYTSRHVVSALAALGIEHDLCAPYQPQEKPHIERWLGTVSHQILEWFPGYTGHSVADAQAIRNRRSFGQRLGEPVVVETRLSAEALQARLDAWCADVYERRPHEGIDGKSPFEAAQALPGLIRNVDERALDLLLAPLAGHRRLSKKGISVGGQTFIAAELGDAGTEVFEIRLDPADFGAIFVFNPKTHAFICRAVDALRCGLDRASIAAEAKARQRADLKAKKAELNRLKRKVDPLAVADAMLAKAAADAGKVAAFPKRAEAASTPAIAAATPKPAEPVRIIDAKAEIDRRNAAMPRAKAVPRPDDERSRWRRWLAIRECADSGAPVDPAARQWADSYAITPEWRAMARTFGWLKNNGK